MTLKLFMKGLKSLNNGERIKKIFFEAKIRT